MQIDNPSVSATYVDEVAAAVEHTRRVQVVVPPGVGRTALVEGLKQRIGPEAASVLLPPLDDADAPLHGLLQSAAHIDRRAVQLATEDARDLRERAKAVAAEFKKQGRILVVWVPPSWHLEASTCEPDVQLRHRRAEDVLGGWLAIEELQIVLLVSSHGVHFVTEVAGNATEWQRVDIAPVSVRSDELDEAATWGAYADAAAKLREALSRRSQHSIPAFQARLLVGLIGLGEAPGALLDRVGAAQRNSFALERYLREVLDRRRNTEIREGIVRFLRARFPVQREVAQRIAKLPEEHMPLLTDCIGQGDTILESDDSLRQALLHKFAKGRGDPRTHMALADYHEELDGALSPADAWRNIKDWLEKTHHLGRSGPAGAERWSRLELPTRELYWDRARSLSIEHRDYMGAAKLYRECLDRFDRRDHYSWHYLGYNLDRAGERRNEAEHAFREAVKLRKDHPWYNGRLVTFLIDQARFRDADEAWQQALERMDPYGENVLASPWLAREVHRWVVRAWLRFGEVGRARDVFDEIAEDSFWDQEWYQELQHELEDAEEALSLGESVYPPETLISERWIRPPQLVSEHDEANRPLRHWFPGRVVEVDAEGIHTALAVPHEDPHARRVIARTLSREEWRQYARCPEQEAEGRYIVVAVYAESGSDEVVRIFLVPHRDHATSDDEIRRATRYLRSGRDARG